MTKTWGIHNNQPDINPVEDGAVRIGWDEVGDLSLLNASRDAFKDAIEERIQDVEKATIPGSSGTLYRFVHGMEDGDVIVCPNRKTRTLDIGTISGPYQFHPESPVHKHWRPVTWVRTGVPREELSLAGLNEVSSATTLFTIKTAEDEVAHLLAAPSLDDRPDYTWTAFYPALVEKILPYRHDRGALLERVWNVAQASGRARLFKYLQGDSYVDGTRGPIRDVDPFTIMATFNRGIRDDARADIAAAYGREFHVQARFPTRFPGIPVVNNLRSWFFDWENIRADHAIDVLWDLCIAAVAYGNEANEDTREALVTAFDAASTGDTARLTMGIYWASPSHFAAYDSRNRAYIKEKFPDLAANLALSSRLSGEQFLDNTEKLTAWLADSKSPFDTFAELSYAAWLDGTSPSQQEEPSPPLDPTVTVLATTLTPVKQDHPALENEPYSVASILDDGAFVPKAELDEMMERLRTKKNIILQGPPGTGKTWLARRLGWALCDERTSPRVQVVQFHPSLTYEDFVRGWRPTGKKLALIDGPFLEICTMAAQDRDHPYVLVIEEINRGNPAQIFGELLTLMEADKRNPDYGMRLAYPRGNERFHVPPNLYVIGTMNVADRSLAIVDMALRRRFAFIETKPSFEDDWAQHVSGLGYDLDLLETYGERIRKLNQAITDDSALGRQYCIGHSFLTPAGERQNTDLDTRQWWRRVVETDIKPLLEEYWFDRPEAAYEAVRKLLGG